MAVRVALRRGDAGPETPEQTHRRLGLETTEETHLRLGLKTAKQGRWKFHLAATVVEVAFAFFAIASLLRLFGYAKHGVWAGIFAVAWLVVGASEFRRWWKKKREVGVF